MRRTARPRSTRRNLNVSSQSNTDMGKKFKSLFGLVFLVGIVVLIILAIIGVKAYDYVKDNGLKNIATELWEGTSTNDNTTNR